MEQGARKTKYKQGADSVREDRNGKVWVAIHILNPNIHRESKCLEHAGGDCSARAWHWKDLQLRNSLWVKVSEPRHQERKPLLRAQKALYWASQTLPRNLETCLIKQYLEVQEPDAGKLDTKQPYLQHCISERIRQKSRKVLWASTSPKLSARDESTDVGGAPWAGLRGRAAEVPSRIPSPRGSQPYRCVQYCLTSSPCTLWRQWLQ